MSLGLIKIEEIDSGTKAPFQNSGLTINREAMRTTKPVTA